MFYRGTNKAFFLPDLITALCKWAGVPVFDVDEVFPMDSPFTLFWLGQVLLLGAKREGRTGIAAVRRSWIRTTGIHSQDGKRLCRLHSGSTQHCPRDRDAPSPAASVEEEVSGEGPPDGPDVEDY
ncbi:hypothetical protein KY290_005043 [Solanum tuberosum]|uniref:Uncharacterized protein n=1 Tax=Solanum tuberosum TaxID=4113 RepID=A0ABQ7WCZ8_SOLTU|nr:hypothetical protein KY289_005411 [Solanum tuberosum]KAH0778616.1 hypothetical protein KY290_005043 [Solanum tuberosum]